MLDASGGEVGRRRHEPSGKYRDGSPPTCLISIATAASGPPSAEPSGICTAGGLSLHHLAPVLRHGRRVRRLPRPTHRKRTCCERARNERSTPRRSRIAVFIRSARHDVSWAEMGSRLPGPRHEETVPGLRLHCVPTAFAVPLAYRPPY